MEDLRPSAGTDPPDCARRRNRSASDRRHEKRQVKFTFGGSRLVDDVARDLTPRQLADLLLFEEQFRRRSERPFATWVRGAARKGRGPARKQFGAPPSDRPTTPGGPPAPRKENRGSVRSSEFRSSEFEFRFGVQEFGVRVPGAMISPPNSPLLNSELPPWTARYTGGPRPTQLPFTMRRSDRA